jgi:hypothetical protein
MRVATSWDLMTLAAGGGGNKGDLIEPLSRYPTALSAVPHLTGLSGFGGVPVYRYSVETLRQLRHELIRAGQPQIATRRNQRRQRSGR